MPINVEITSVNKRYVADFNDLEEGGALYMDREGDIGFRVAHCWVALTPTSGLVVVDDVHNYGPWVHLPVGTSITLIND